MPEALKEEEQTEDTQEEAPEEDTDEAELDEEALEDLLGEKVMENIDESAEKVAKRYMDAMEKASADRAKAFGEEESEEKQTDLDDQEVKSFQERITNDKRATLQTSLSDLKAYVEKDTSISSNYTGDVLLSEVDEGVVNVNKREPFIRELVSVGTIDGQVDVWLEVTNENGDPASVAELDAMPEKDYDYEEKDAKVKKVGVHNKHSREMAEDLPSIVTDIENELVRDLELEIDDQILAGDGTGNNLTGIRQNETAFSAGNFSGTLSGNANRFDVLNVAVGQVYNKDFQPNYIVLHPEDVTGMNLEKDADGNYVMPPFTTSDRQRVRGIPVITNTGISAGDFLVGDFSRSIVKVKRDVSVEMTNTDQDDFVKDRFTVRASARLSHRVSANEYEAFVGGTFSSAQTALNV